MDKSKSNIRPPPQEKETEKRDKSFQYPELFPPSFLPPSFLLLFFPLPSPPARQSKSFALCSFRHTGKVHDGGGRSDTFEELANPLFCGKANKCCSLEYANQNLQVFESELPNRSNANRPYRRTSCFAAAAAGERAREIDQFPFDCQSHGEIASRPRPPACPIFAISLFFQWLTPYA